MASLSQLLIERDILSEGDLARAENMRVHTKAGLPFVLSQLGLVSDDDLAGYLSEIHDCPKADARFFPEELPEIDGLNPQWLESRAVLPLEMRDNALEIAIADPEDYEAIEGMRFASERDVHVQVAPRSDITDHLAMVTAYHSDTSDDGDAALSDLERFTQTGSEAPVIKLVDRLLAAAAKRHASDVHIEPMARHIAVRYRVDGHLREVERQPAILAEAIASRIKVMAGLDISESRLPQDGRLRQTIAGRDIDIRVSTSPAAHGESIVMRLLGRSELTLELDNLGIPDAALQKLTRALGRPNGIILLTGPTGSGKTSTLYASLKHLRRPDVKILTVEDPIEILLDGVNQVQVRPDIDLDYARTLRAFLRQDPDILMVGEIRDRDTADIALRAALTGHLVLSTLHTNSALGAFTRLKDIGIEPFLASSTIVAAIAQRLIRKLCPECRTVRAPDQAESAMFAQYGVSVPSQVHEPVGCASCNETGYSGRTPLFEIVEADKKLRALIGDSRAEEYELPLPETLMGHGLALVADGTTNMGEISRAVTLA